MLTDVTPNIPKRDKTETRALYGGRIRIARMKAGYTQAGLANELFVAQNVLSRWETGERMPDIDEFKAIGLALGINWLDLVK